LNSQTITSIPPDLYDQFYKLSCKTGKSWGEYTRLCFEIGMLTIANRGGLAKEKGPPPKPPGHQTAKVSLPRSHALRLEAMAKDAGWRWQDAQRLVLTFGMLGLESVGGVEGYYAAVEAAKAKIFEPEKAA
jgi:hypothetical protein